MKNGSIYAVLIVCSVMMIGAAFGLIDPSLIAPAKANNIAEMVGIIDAWNQIKLSCGIIVGACMVGDILAVGMLIGNSKEGYLKEEEL